MSHADDALDNLNTLMASLLDESRKQTALLAKIGNDRASAPMATPATRPASGGGSAPTGGPVFPFGRSKGKPIAGGKLDDLEWMATAVSASLSDPDKQRWHDQNSALFAALTAEIARQTGKPADDWRGPPPEELGGAVANGAPTDDDVPFAFIETRLNFP